MFIYIDSSVFICDSSGGVAFTAVAKDRLAVAIS